MRRRELFKLLGSLLSFVLLLFNSNLNGADTYIPERDAIVRIITPDKGYFCTGFNVDPSGIILTAKHCGCDESTTVTFDAGMKFKARVVFNPPDVEGPVVLRVDGGTNLPYVKVAEIAPELNESVYSLGYPATQFAYHEGHVRRMTSQQSPTGPLYFIETTHRVFEGNSGGPLFNQKSEVVGIASQRSLMPNERGYNNDKIASFWIHTNFINKALREVRDKVQPKPQEQPQVQPNVNKPTLVVISGVLCAPCIQHQNDYEGNVGGLKQFIDSNFNRVVVHRNAVGLWSDPELIKRYEVTNGAVEAIPIFWIDGMLNKKGYNGPRDLIAELTAVMSSETLPERFKRSDPPATPNAPSPTPLPKPENSTQVDWGDVTVVVVIKKTDVPAIIAESMIRLAKGPVTRQLNELSEGKATIHLVTERSDKAKYDALTEDVGLVPNPVAVIVLIGKQSLGLKSVIAPMIESRIKAAIEGVSKNPVPIELIFKRINSQAYDQVIDSLSVSTPSNPNVPNTPVSNDTLIGTVIGAITGWYAYFVGRKKPTVATPVAPTGETK